MTSATSLPRQHFALVFLALLTTAAGNTALQAILPVIGREIHIPDMAIAMVFSLSALLWTLAAPHWARRSDMEGRKKLMKLGVIGFGSSMLLCGLVILAGIEGLIAPMMTFLLFTLARALFGIFGSASNPAAQAYVAARTPATERTAALALLASAFGLGTILGPGVAPLFVLPGVGLAGPMFAFTLIGIAVLLAIHLGLPDDTPDHIAAPRAGRGAAAAIPSVGASPVGASATAADASSAAGRRERIRLTDPRIKPFMIYGFFAGSAQAATGQAIGFFIIDRLSDAGMAATQLIAITFMAGAGATLLAQWGILRLLNLDPSQLMRWGAVLAAIGTLGIAFADNFHLLLLAFALASAGFGFARPGFMAGSSLAVSRTEQGAVAGLVTSVNGATFVLAPAIGIGLYQLVPELPYWLGAAGMVALAAYAWRNVLLRESRPSGQQ